LLAIYTTVYSYVQPYKRQVTNIIETAVNLNFLLLLLLNATLYFHEDFFTFLSLSRSSSEDGCLGSGIAVISWIFMPFYYLPLVTLCITAAVFGVLYLRYLYSAVDCPLYIANEIMQTLRIRRLQGKGLLWR